jgi:hypothetical protein
LSPWFETSQLKIRLHLLFQLAHLDLLFNGYLPANASSTVKEDCKKKTMVQQRVKWQAKKQLYVKKLCSSGKGGYSGSTAQRFSPSAGNQDRR